MQFLCLICTERMDEQLPPDEAARQRDEYAAFLNDIGGSGHYVGCNRLLPPASAVTLRVRDGKVAATGGPYAETKEQVGGYFVLDARDLNEAIRIAARIPGARHGCVEVRPIAESLPSHDTVKFPRKSTEMEMR